MAIHDNLLSGQFSPVGESLIDHSLSATDKIPKKEGLKKKTDA